MNTSRRILAFVALFTSVLVVLACQAQLGPATLSPPPVESAFAPGNPTAMPTLPLVTPFPDLPVEAILILSLGSGSQITSPVTVAGMSNPTFENNLVIEVHDEAGNIIGLTPTTIQSDISQRGPFEAAVEFTAPAAPRPGRVIVYDTSARDGNIIHLASVEVTLLPAGGTPDIKAGGEHPEDIVIYIPALTEVINGGIVNVVGYAVPTFEQALNIVVLDETGTIVGSGATVIQADFGNPGPFDSSVSYSVTTEQPGSVQVFSASPRDGGITHLASVEVRLQP